MNPSTVLSTEAILFTKLTISQFEFTAFWENIVRKMCIVKKKQYADRY